jgi:alpha-N-arabinofuranosidase
VNAIAPIATEPGGDAWRQATFFPFAVTSRLAVGDALVVKLESGTYDTALHGEVCTVDAVATHDPETGRSAVFVVNRSQDAAASFTVDVSRLGEVSVLETQSLHDDDIYAANTLGDQHRVGLRPNDTAAIVDGRLTLELPPVSWTAIALG